jgi:hypothetical protein
MQYPTSSNPMVNTEFLEGVKSRVSKKVWEQEYEARFSEDSGLLFENIRSNLRGIQEFDKNTYYWGGIDLGFTNDYCVVVVIDDFGVVDYLRFKDESKNFSRAADTIYEFLEKWDFPKTHIEINKYDSIATLLRQRYCSYLYDHLTTGKSKNTMINDLIDLFVNEKIYLLNDEDFIREFETYSYEISAAGNTIYNAAAGCHDDIVMATALAYYSKNNSPSFEI